MKVKSEHKKDNVQKYSFPESIKITIIVSKFNSAITDNLLTGALRLLTDYGIKNDHVEVIKVPGALEIPYTLKQVCKMKSRPDGVIVLGCIIKGETAHFEYISDNAIRNIVSISIKYDMPLGFGVLTCYNEAQARARSSVESITDDSNKGVEAARALLDMLELQLKR
ncbi:MAG: 6,7-dimethyl-8-ribityllumazine synthase [Ignavibacteria bacterium]